MSSAFASLAIPKSILDTDLYKLTMQQAVLHHFPDVKATYRFTNRDKSALFSRQSVERFRTAVSFFTSLSLTQIELDWLRKTCPYFTSEYLSYLAAYRYQPEQVHITYVPVSTDELFGHVDIQVQGLWAETILWEVPLMACLSETYFQYVITDWNYDGQEINAYSKAQQLLQSGCVISEFGSRRRRSYHAQDIVIKELVRASKAICTSDSGRLAGTSNVHFAQKYSITPIGTVAHEWFMGVGALKGYEHANNMSLDLWESVYLKDVPLVALTDTFSTKAFFNEFVVDPERAQRWTGLRQDSGDPLTFGPRVKEMYESIGVDYTEKAMVYSDSLNTTMALRIKKQCDQLGFKQVSFGIGTFFTNDFYTFSSGGSEKSKALNIVIKLSSVNGLPCVKISDDLTKNTGDRATVEHVKEVFNLVV